MKDWDFHWYCTACYNIFEYKVFPKVKTTREFSKLLKLKSPTLSSYCLLHTRDTN